MAPASKERLARMQGGLDTSIVLDAPTLKQLFSGAVDAIVALVTEQLRAVMDSGMSLSMVGVLWVECC